MDKLYDAGGEYKRIFEIDFIRGLCILLVMLDHLMYKFAVCYVEVPFFMAMRGLGYKYWYWQVRTDVRNVVLVLFFVVSGLSSSFSKNNVVRGLKMLGFAMALTAVTYIASYFTGAVGINIDFGFIHVFACSILIYGLISKWKNIWILLLAGVCIFLSWYIPTLEISTLSTLFLPIGIKPIGYQYGDYASLFPWLGYFFIGGVLGKIFYPQRKSLLKPVKPAITKPLLHMGRNSLWYYFGEMAILLPIFYIIAIVFA
ncbi:MAG: heparan-alpha-glucosaminide N-acetyltransferase domain-containing protein [Bacillota bacterium]